ncbi:MAG: winged helix-turn-helix domain-containing protein [Myxococcota bacterium]
MPAMSDPFDPPLELVSGRVDLQRGVLHGPDGEVRLTSREAALLAHLAARPGEVVSRNELLREVFGVSERVRSRTVDTTMARLRQKIEPDPAAPVHLRTLTGRGVQFVPREVSAAPDALALGRWRFDPAAGTLVAPGEVRALTPQQVALLTCLGRARGATVSDAELLAALTDGKGGSRRSLTTAVYRLRSLLEDDPGNPVHLVTVPGEGYRLVAHAPRTGEVPAGRPLFGREELVGAVLDALTRGVVALVGPAGIGKSHLAREVVERLPESTEVAWVSLRDAPGPDGAREALGQALRVPPDAGSLQARLAGFAGVLVLEDAEPSHALAPWLAGVTALVTALQPPDPDGMLVIEVPPLDEAAAAELFRHEAGVVPDHALAGPPLQVLLAARRARSDPGLPHDAGVEATWDALAEADRSVWAQASVFVGSFDLDAAEAVIETRGWVVDRLASLADAAVLTLEHSAGGLRYHLHAHLRALGAERLTGVERDATEHRLVEWGRRLARRHEVWVGVGTHEADIPNLRRAHRLRPLDPDLTRILVWPEQQRLDAHAALALMAPLLAVDPDPALLIEEAGVRIGMLDFDGAAAALDRMPELPSPTLRAGREWMRALIVRHHEGERAMDRHVRVGLALDGVDPMMRQALLLMGADAAVTSGDPDRAESLALEALRLPGNPVTALLRLADVARSRGDFAAAIEHLQAALRRPGDPAVRGNIRRMLGFIELLADRLEDAERTLVLCLDHARSLGQAHGLGGTLMNVVRLRVMQRRYAEVPELIAEALKGVTVPSPPYAWFHAWDAAVAALTGRPDDARTAARHYAEWMGTAPDPGFFAVLRPLWDPSAPEVDAPDTLDGRIATRCRREAVSPPA